MEDLCQSKFLMQLDFSDALNWYFEARCNVGVSVERNSGNVRFLSQVLREKFETAFKGFRNLQSEEGPQQGDSIGPSYCIFSEDPSNRFRASSKLDIWTVLLPGESGCAATKDEIISH